MEESAKNGFRKLKYILAISLIINLTFGLSFGITLYQNTSLNHKINSLIEYNDNITKTQKILSQRNELLEKQLSYYKQQAEYYSKLSHSTETAHGLIGQSFIDIVAVRQIVDGSFETHFEGVVMGLHIELKVGEGRLLINTQPNIGIDLQTSAKTASIVAENFTGISLKRTDVIITVISEEEVQVVDGPSAGAAITTALIAAILNSDLNQTIKISGTIAPDGTIGQVGGIIEKALAASKNNAKVFLVPKGQSSVTIYEYEERTPLPGFTIITSKPKHVSLEDYLKDNGYDLKIIEVEDISHAYEFLIK